MKKNTASRSAFLNMRLLVGAVLFFASLFLALLGLGAFSNALAQAPPRKGQKSPGTQPGPSQPATVAQQPIAPSSISVIDFKELAKEIEKAPSATSNVQDCIASTFSTGAVAPTETPSFQPVLSYTAEEQPFDAHNGFVFFVIPPDTMGAVGPNHLFTTLNTNYFVQDKATGAVLSEMSGRDFWAKTGVTYTGGSNLAFDPYNARWIITGIGQSPSASTTDSVLIGLSSTSDPEGTWTLRSITIGTSPELLLLGFNKNWIAVGWNEFDGGSLLIIDYPALRAGTLIKTIVPARTSPGSIHMHPAITLDPTEETLFVPAQVDGGNAQYKLHKITGTPSSPNFMFEDDPVRHTRPGGGWSGPAGDSGQDILPQTCFGVPGVTCPVTPRFISAPSDFLTSDVIFRNGDIWYSQTIQLPIGDVNPTTTHTAVQWTRIDRTGTFVDGGRVEDSMANSSQGEWYAYPSIAVNAENDMLLGFSQFSASHLANAGYAFRFGSDPPGAIRSPIFVKQGEDYYAKTFGLPNNVWGFYSNAAVDPSNDLDMWTIQEYAGTRTVQDAQQTSNACRWATWWAKVCGSKSPCIIGGDVSALGTVGQQFVHQISATNYPISYDAVQLPPGLTVDHDFGIISGTPTVSGDFSISVSASNSVPGTGSATLELIVQPASGAQIVSSKAATGRTGQPFIFHLLTDPPSAQVSTSTDPVSALPPGLCFDPMTGLISGTPTANGTFRPVLTVSDGAVVNTFTLQLTFTSDPAVPVIGSTAFNVAQKPVENSATSPSTFGSTDIILTPGQTITPYVIPRGAIATGFAPIPNLPSGLQFDASTGTISGTYTGEGVANHSAMYAGRLVSTGIPVGNSVSPNTIRIVRPLISVCQPAARNESGTGTAPINFFDQLNVSNDIPPIVAEATGPFGAVVNFPPFTVTDDYGNKFPFTCEPSSGSTFPLDETTGVTCTSAADSAGAFTEVTFDVTVQDTTPPVITVPSDQSVPAVSALGAVVTFNAPTWTDKVDGLGEATTDHQSGDQFPMGSTVVHCSHTDVHNNTGTGSFNVAVNDITATSVSGSGTINGPSGQASFSINASKNKKNKWKTTFSYSDPAVPLRFTAKTLSGFTVGRYHVHCAGSAKLAKKMNGAFTVDLTDNGSPGTLDTFSMTLSTGYSASGNLTSGDIVIH